MTKVHISFQEVITLVPFLAHSDDIFILRQHFIDRDDQILQDGPVFIIRIILHLLLECFNDLAFLHKMQMHPKAALILMFMFVSLHKAGEFIIHSHDLRRILLKILDAESSNFHLGDTVPDRFGEILTQRFHRILHLAIRIDDMLRMAELQPIPFPRLLGLVGYERIDLLIKHVEQIDTALEDKSLC